MAKWPTEDDPGRAVIAPTGYGTLGVWWSNFEAMENRGGYSGPFNNEAEARQCINDWAKVFDTPVEITVSDVRPA